MKYYNYTRPPKDVDETLQRYFSDRYGACVYLDLDGEIDFIEICLVMREGRGTKWTHYANIVNMHSRKDTWELNEQFIKIDEDFCKRWGSDYDKYIGTEQTAMNIYGYFKTLNGAIRNLALKGTSINGRKPKEVYV